MPVRSSTSAVLKWPGPATVRRAVAEWAAHHLAHRSGLLRVGYFGSYARGDTGVGSDLNLVAVVEDSPLPFHRRGAKWELEGLPVPAEIIVYTQREWGALKQRDGRFPRTLVGETVWLS